MRIRRSLNPTLAIEGILLTMYDERTTLSRQVASDLRSFFGSQVFATVIPRNVRLAEAPSHGKPIIFYDIHSKGAESYIQLAKEVIQNEQKRTGQGFGSTNPGAEPTPPQHQQPLQVAQQTPQFQPELSPLQAMTPREIDVDLIDPNPYQPRTHFGEEALGELARSIQSSGVIQPLVLRRNGSRFQLVAGERRWRAAQRAGLLRVPAILRDIPEEQLSKSHLSRTFSAKT